MSIEIYDLEARVAHDVWRTVQDWLADAMAYHPVMDVVDLYHIVMAGRAQLVVVIDDGRITGAAVMEVVQYPSNLVSNCIALGGEYGFLHRAVPDLVDHLIAWSRAHGCDRMVAYGRPGWSRALRRYGVSTAPATATCWMPIEERPSSRH